MTRVLAMPTDEEGMAALEAFVRGMTRTPEDRPEAAPETARETAVRAIRETETRVSTVLPPSIVRHEAQGRAHGTAETRRLMRCAAVRSGIARGRRVGSPNGPTKAITQRLHWTRRCPTN